MIFINQSEDLKYFEIYEQSFNWDTMLPYYNNHQYFFGDRDVLVDDILFRVQRECYCHNDGYCIDFCFRNGKYYCNTIYELEEIIQQYILIPENFILTKRDEDSLDISILLDSKLHINKK